MKEKKKFYLKRLDDIQSEVQKRKESPEVKQSVNAWAEREYGIKNYLDIVHGYFEIPKHDKTLAVLCRQVPSVCAEDIGCYVASLAAGLQPLAMPFMQDTFTARNHDKKARVKIPMTSISKKGALLVKNQIMYEGNMESLEKKSLGTINFPGYGTLPEYHSMLRARVFGNTYPSFDVSELDMILCKEARRKPDFVYIQNCDGFVERTSYNKINGSSFRPPADWYYPLYFSWFIDGSMVLLETYDNPEGDVFEAKKLFERTMNHLITETNWSPMVVKIPPLSPSMLFCNDQIISNPEPGQAIRAIIHNTKAVVNLYDSFQEIVQKASITALNYR